MDEYDLVKKSSLKFKGVKKKKKSKSKSKSEDRRHDAGQDSNNLDERAEDADIHGGWWKVEKYEHIRDDIAIEFLPGCYIKALNNGSMVLGDLHPPEEGPEEEEIFTAVCAGTNQIALKSGFGRYLSIDSRKRLMGLSEAIGDQETFLPVFEDGRQALCAYNDCFLSPDDDSPEPQPIVARATKVGPKEMLTIRVVQDPVLYDKKPKETKSGLLYEAEAGYLSKFHPEGQKHTSSSEDKKQLKKARLEGELHEALLDKRVKHKSDKYCK